MHPHFSDLIEVPLLQQVMKDLWQATGLPAEIISTDGTVLAATGGQTICTDFHRRNSQTLECCRRSEACIKAHPTGTDKSPHGEPVEYICRNGMNDAAVPIKAAGRHLGMLFLGQFFNHPPDEETFRRQARQFGFDETSYLEALRQVPIISPERVRDILRLYSSFVQLLGQQGSEKLQLLQAQEALLRRKQRLGVQNQELRRIGALRGSYRGMSERIIPHIIESAAHTLDVARAGFWRFEEKETKLECVDLYVTAAAEHRRGKGLETAHYPDYFFSLESAINIAADQAQSDPRTRELCEPYLKPHGITSLLDSPVWLGGRMVGVLCCEHVGEPRHWSLDEQNFAASMADQISQALEGEERRLAEEALRESEEKYRLLFINDSDAILFFDAETLNIEEANEAAASLYGYSREELAGLSILDLSAEAEKSCARIRENRGKRIVRIPEARHRKHDGSEFSVEISHGNFDWKGRLMCVRVVRDISERQEMMRLKDEMLSAVSHEIRTPLTAILGFAEFLRTSEDKDVPIHHYLDIIVREGERLKELTDNLLDLQRLRAGFGRKTFRMFEVPPMLISVAQLFDGVSSRHRLVCETPEGLPALWGDERQLYRALQNLLSNACKYSPEGSEIELGVSREDDFIRFWVRDQGDGILPEYQADIFERFFRVDYQRGKKVGGTGLGLALVRAIAEIHNGQVWVESQPGQGSTFLLSIPYARPVEDS